MLDDILRATYTAQDCAFALQHGNFSNFRRDLTRGGALFFPRRTSAGPGGGEYRYAHILEMGIHLAVVHRKPPIGKQIVGGLTRLLTGNGYGLNKVNAMEQDERNVILFGGAGFAENDFPPHVPHDTTWVVNFPTIFLNEDFISRDPNRPTYLIFNAPVSNEKITADVELIGDMTLSAVRERIFKLKTQYISPEDRRFLEIKDEECDDFPVISLTNILARIDRRLSLRLKAKDIRGV